MKSRLDYYLDKYLEILTIKNYSRSTVRIHKRNIAFFLSWLKERGITRVQSVTMNVLSEYQDYLYKYKRPNAKNPKRRRLTSDIRRRYLSSLKLFFSFLTKRGSILFNPAMEIELPKRSFRIPRDVLSQRETEDIIRQADILTHIGLRDRAILEVLYSTGMRRSELLNLKLSNIDHSRGVLEIRKGKGNKDRFVPIGRRALRWVMEYIDKARNDLCCIESSDFLFLNEDGEKLKGSELGSLIKAYIKKAKVKKSGSCHMFRHTMATLMLENGADLRFIQEILGHKQIRTTQVYTKVSINKLREVYERTCPSAFALKEASCEPEK